MNVSVHGAKTQLSKLLDMVEDGESIVIERHGRPVAQLVPVRKRRVSPRLLPQVRWTTHALVLGCRRGRG